jgi:uncharacterized membrane protein
MLELLPPLNDHNLPWMDTIHPIVVHFVIAMASIAFVFDVVGVVWRKPAPFVGQLLELVVRHRRDLRGDHLWAGGGPVWRRPTGPLAIFLDIQTTIGWSLAACVVAARGSALCAAAIATLRCYRCRRVIWGRAALVSALVVVQMLLGDRLSLDLAMDSTPVKVVAAMREGLIAMVTLPPPTPPPLLELAYAPEQPPGRADRPDVGGQWPSAICILTKCYLPTCYQRGDEVFIRLIETLFCCSTPVREST